MANARGIRAGAAYVELFLSDSKLVRGLQNASRKLKAFGDAITGWGQTMTAIGAAITAPLLGSAKAFGEMGDRMAKMSQRTGISVETLSELAYAAELSGADLDTLEGSLRKMQKAIVEAAEGSESATDALGKLGLTVADLRGLSPDQQFKLIADRLSQVQSPAMKAALAMALFGKSGTQLLPLMLEGSRGIEALQQQARRLGLTLSTEDAKAAEALHDAFDTLWKVIKQGVFVLGSALAPTLRGVSEWIVRTVIATTAWIKENKDLMVTILKIAAAVVAGGVALLALGAGLSTTSTILGALAVVATGVGVALKVMAATLAAMLSPLGLVIGAVTALGAYLVYASDAGGQALQWLADQFRGLWKFAGQSVQGIADALAAGDIALAARILWLSLKVVWESGVLQLQQVWLDFKNFFLRIAYGAFHGLRAAWQIVGNALCTAWIELEGFAGRVWTNITSAFTKAWNTAITWTEKRLHDLWGLMDSGYDAKTAKAMADEDLASKNQKVDEETKAALARQNDQLKFERQQNEDYNNGQLALIGKDYHDASDQLDDEAKAKLIAAESELKAARSEWQAALAEAQSKRAALEAATPERLRPLGDLPDYLEGLGGSLEQARNTLGASGTFNAGDAAYLGGGDASQQLLRVSQEMAASLKRLAQQAQEGRLVFAS